MKKVLSVFLVIATLLSLASCSGRTKKQKEPEKVALENVYLAEKIALPEGIDAYNLYVSGDNVFLKGSKNEHYVDEDGVEQYKYMEVVYRTDKTFEEFNEFFTFESDYFYDPETHEDRSTYFNNAMPDGQGGLWVNVSSYYSKPVDDTMSEWISENNTELRHYNANGELTRTIDCKEILSTVPDIDTTELNSIYVNSLVQANDGTLYIMTNQRITAISPDGNVVESNSLDDNTYFNSMSALDDGKLRAICYSWTAEKSVTEVLDYDIATNEFKTVCELSVNDNVFMDSKGNVYTNDDYVVSRVDIATGKEKPILDWINSDINCDRIFNFSIHNDELYTFEWDNDYESRSILHLTPAGEGEIIEKYVITLATGTLDSNLKNMIIDYNRSSLDYRIQVKAYGWEEGATEKFDLDLLSGNVPDIICLDQLNVEKYASKGLLADLGALIDADEEISREHFLPNILEACEIRGKLYRLPTAFSVRSLSGKTSVVGDRTSWTWDDMLALMKEYPNAQLLSEMDRTNLMQSFLPLIMGDFIDYNTGKANFTDGNFAKFLEFAKTFPAEIDWEKYYENIDWEEYDKRYQENKVLLMMSYLSSVNGEYYNTETFGEPVTYIGYPAASGNGNSLYLASQFAIGEKSVYKEQAWDFLKMVFGEEYQENYIWQIPVVKASFEKKKQKAIDNANGIYEDDIIVDYDMIAMSAFAEPVEVATANEITVEKPVVLPDEPIVEEDPKVVEYRERMLKHIEDVSRLATTANRIARYNDPMIDVIADECAPYFDGKKSLEETCKIIESRVNLYLAENM